MTTHPYLHQGLSILNANLQPSESRPAIPTGRDIHPFLTISRETCAGATTLGEHLLPLLNTRLREEGRSWMFLDKNLMNRALDQRHLPEDLAKYLPEDRIFEIKGLIGELIGLHPPLWELEHHITEAIRRFAQLGCVILAGRAAHLITSDLPGGFHLRLIAPLETRIRRAQQLRHCERKAAELFIRESDLARQRHVQNSFEQDINDPHAYDLVINTGRIAPADAAQQVLQAMQARVGTSFAERPET